MLIDSSPQRSSMASGKAGYSSKTWNILDRCYGSKTCNMRLHSYKKQKNKQIYAHRWSREEGENQRGDPRLRHMFGMAYYKGIVHIIDVHGGEGTGRVYTEVLFIF